MPLPTSQQHHVRRFSKRRRHRSRSLNQSRFIGRLSPDLLFRVRYQYRWPFALAAGLLAALAIQMGLQATASPVEVVSTSSNDLELANASQSDNQPSQPSFDEEKPGLPIGPNDRVIVIDRPAGLELASEGQVVEVVAIGGFDGVITAKPLTDSALVIARSETSASLVVTKAEALGILEAQAFGSVAFLAVG